MRTTSLALVLVCALTCTLVAGNAGDGIPVPSLPVLKKTELDGGLLIEELKLGDGLEAKAGGAVVAHYHGTLKDNPAVVFDSSYRRSEPLGLPLSSVIPGWQAGIPGMKVGGIRRLTVPAALAYGDQSPSPLIPANSDLVFIVELVDVMQTQDLKLGEGEAATSRCVAVTAFKITDSDGNVLEQRDARDPYIWVRNEYQPISVGIEGMRRGGKRKITVPAALNRMNPTFDSFRAVGIPVTIEVELLNLKNIPAEANAPGC
jgi:FKBP-type peptidyl-prolyl cis-trans isomerase 2